MAIFYIDYEGGNDANDGLSFANRWKTVTSGATAARIAPGDEIRLMASPEPTLVGDVAWTQYSRVLTLPAPVTMNICDCETLWTASANVVVTKSTTLFREGTASINVAPATAFTTGKAAYFATGLLDLSAYQQVSFMFRSNLAISTADSLSLRLCSDTTGDVPVHTIPIPTPIGTGYWLPVTLNFGTNLSNSIQSVALYQDVDLAASGLNIDNIIACKAASAPDSLTHQSLIGRVHSLSWAPSTSYALNSLRIPTTAKRNGLRYRVTTAGTTSGSEPVWPESYGGTVTDGTVVWTADSLEDTWYAIGSINGTLVNIDCAPDDNSITSSRGQSEATETVATYKREPILLPLVNGTSTVMNTINDLGSSTALIRFTGGWDRTAMATQNGQTWWSARSGFGYLFSGSVNNIELSNISAVRAQLGFANASSSGVIRLTNVHFNHMVFGTVWASSSPVNYTIVGLVACNGSANSGYGHMAYTGQHTYSRMRLENNSNTGIGVTDSTKNRLRLAQFSIRNNAGYGVSYAGVGPANLYDGVFANNTNASVRDFYAQMRLRNVLMSDATEFLALTGHFDGYTYSQDHDQVSGTHLLVADGGTIRSATDQRHSPSGIAWKFNPTATYRGPYLPLEMPIGKVVLLANTALTVGVWVRRDSTNIKGKMLVRGGQIAGISADIATDCTPAINSWVKHTLTMTATETGVVEVLFQCYDGVGTTNSLWIDDISLE